MLGGQEDQRPQEPCAVKGIKHSSENSRSRGLGKTPRRYAEAPGAEKSHQCLPALVPYCCFTTVFTIFYVAMNEKKNGQSNFRQERFKNKSLIISECNPSQLGKHCSRSFSCHSSRNVCLSLFILCPTKKHILKTGTRNKYDLLDPTNPRDLLLPLGLPFLKFSQPYKTVP